MNDWEQHPRWKNCPKWKKTRAVDFILLYILKVQFYWYYPIQALLFRRYVPDFPAGTLKRHQFFCVRQEEPAILISRLQLSMHGTYASRAVGTHRKQHRFQLQASHGIFIIIIIIIIITF